jgi:hypothetical protein
MHAGLLVEDEFLRKQVQHFAVGRKRNVLRLLDSLTNLLASNLARAAEDQATVSIDPTDMRAGDAERGVLNRNSGGIFGSLDRLRDRCDRLVEIDNDAFARAARISQTVTAIAQTVVGDLDNEDACLRAAYVDGGQEMFGRPGH